MKSIVYYIMGVWAHIQKVHINTLGSWVPFVISERAAMWSRVESGLLGIEKLAAATSRRLNCVYVCLCV